MRRVLLVVLLLVLIAALSVPFVAAAVHRAHPKPHPRIHLVHDMDRQAKFKPQAAIGVFSDGRAMRTAPANTREWSLAAPDEAFLRGAVGEAWIDGFPEVIEPDEALLERGAQRFTIYCSPCHGDVGMGDGTVAQAARRRGDTAWVSPTVLTAPEVTERPNGHLFNTITNGIRGMKGYGPQIPPEDRWAIVAHIREMQQHARNTRTP